jgi:hypothetical protein
MRVLNCFCERIFLALFFLLFAQFLPVRSQQPEAANQSQPSENESAVQLAQQILQQTQTAGCISGECRILVTDFILPDRHTSAFGMKLADGLSAQFTKGEKPLLAIDRSQYRAFLQQERLLPGLQNEEAVARWLAKKLDANFVVVGEIKRVGKNEIEVNARFLNVADEKGKVLKLNTRLRVDDLLVDLSPSDALPPLPPFADSKGNEEIRRAGVKGVGVPMCFYMPNPPATDDAKTTHFTGRVLVEAVVGTSTKLETLRIVNGAPYGLNDPTLRTMRTWKCNPATLNGNPIPTIVTFEVNIRTP